MKMKRPNFNGKAIEPKVCRVRQAERQCSKLVIKVSMGLRLPTRKPASRLVVGTARFRDERLSPSQKMQIPRTRWIASSSPSITESRISASSEEQRPLCAFGWLRFPVTLDFLLIMNENQSTVGEEMKRFILNFNQTRGLHNGPPLPCPYMQIWFCGTMVRALNGIQSDFRLCSASVRIDRRRTSVPIEFM